VQHDGHTETLTRPRSGGVAEDALDLERKRPFRWLVRAGFVARGVTYGVIGGITAALALGAGSEGERPNQQGALEAIAAAPLGKAILLVAAAGLLAYALWKTGRGLFGRGPEGGGRLSPVNRARELIGGIVYVGFAAAAIRVLIGAAGNQTQEQRSAAAGVLGWPGGRFLVGAFGVGLIAVSAYQVYSAVRGDFARDNKTSDMGEAEHGVFLVLGRVGLTARAVVFALVGYFLLQAAIDFEPGGVGIDGTLAELHGTPPGPWLLGLTACGLLVFAGFSFFEARYQRL
jgi:hypothetical protein